MNAIENPSSPAEVLPPENQTVLILRGEGLNSASPERLADISRALVSLVSEVTYVEVARTGTEPQVVAGDTVQQPIFVLKRDLAAFALAHGYSKARVSRVWTDVASLAIKPVKDDIYPAIRRGGELPHVDRDDITIDLRSVHARLVASDVSYKGWPSWNPNQEGNVYFLAHFVNVQLDLEDDEALPTTAKR